MICRDVPEITFNRFATGGTRLFGPSETLAATASDPDTIEALLDNVTGFLCRYALEFRAAAPTRLTLLLEAPAATAPSAPETFTWKRSFAPGRTRISRPR